MRAASRMIGLMASHRVSAEASGYGAAGRSQPEYVRPVPAPQYVRPAGHARLGSENEPCIAPSPSRQRAGMEQGPRRLRPAAPDAAAAASPCALGARSGA